MDAARTAKQNGAKEVYVLYRKGVEDMPATKVEIEEAKEDGIKFKLYKSPLEITEEGIKYIETKKVVLEDGSVNLVSIEGSENIFECDSVIIAISQLPKNNIVNNTKGLETNKSGLLLADNTGHTTRNGVFASGDVVTGAKTVVQAVADAKNVAEAIDEYCNKLREI